MVPHNDMSKNQKQFLQTIKRSIIQALKNLHKSTFIPFINFFILSKKLNFQKLCFYSSIFSILHLPIFINLDRLIKA